MSNERDNKPDDENPVEDEDLKEFEDDTDEVEEGDLFEYEEKEFIKSIDDYKEDIESYLPEFRRIFLTDKDDVFQNLKSEIENIFEEYNSKHINSLVLYIGRTYEFIIYQIGWFILDDWMYLYRYKHEDHPNYMKSLQDILKEIKEYFRIKTGSNQNKIIGKFQNKISEKRNDVAHPCQFGSLRLVDIEDAEQSLMTLIDAISFFSSKFQEILSK